MRIVSQEQPPGKDIPLNEWLSRLVININAALKSSISEYYDFKIVDDVYPASGDLTTLGNQVIICKNTVAKTIVLQSNPPIGTEVNIKRKDAIVTVSGPIDGVSYKIINVRYYSMKLYYDGTEWSEI
jgi:hypothetical protein